MRDSVDKCRLISSIRSEAGLKRDIDEEEQDAKESHGQYEHHIYRQKAGRHVMLFCPKAIDAAGLRPQCLIRQKMNESLEA